MTIQQALTLAQTSNLDLVEISPQAQPPVCKIIDYGKFRYQQTKKEKESKRAQHQVKIKEIKIKPNTDEHDLSFKVKKAREFIGEGHKVRITCVFRGREMAHPDVGRRNVEKMVERLADVASAESPSKLMGKNLSVTLAPGVKKSKEIQSESKNEAQKSDLESL